MVEEVKVPSLGESVTEAVISVILKKDGDYVAEDEEIVEVETEKVNQVLYAPASGIIHYTVKVDDTVAIGQVIASIEPGSAPSESKSESVEKEKDKVVEATKPVEKVVASKPQAPDIRGGSRKSIEEYLSETPDSSKKAMSKIESISSDISHGSREDRKRMSRIRQTIAKRLVEVGQTTAMLTTFAEADMAAVMELRKKHKDAFEKEHGVRLGFMSFFVKAVVASLKAFPQLNSYIDGEDLVQRNYYDIGIAISSDRGLVVPVVKNCDLLSFAGIEQSIVDFSLKARQGGLSIDDLKGGSFTITNGGVFGSMLSTPILNAPQCGILGMHNIVERPVAINGNIVIRPIMYLALSYDHRVVDGKEAISFLRHVAKTIEDPYCLLIDL